MHLLGEELEGLRLLQMGELVDGYDLSQKEQSDFGDQSCLPFLKSVKALSPRPFASTARFEFIAFLIQGFFSPALIMFGRVIVPPLVTSAP